MYWNLCRSHRDPGGPRKENGHSEERPKLLVLFYGSRSPKLSVSIITDQLARSILIAGENDSLGGLESENKTKTFGHTLLGLSVLNWVTID